MPTANRFFRSMIFVLPVLLVLVISGCSLNFEKAGQKLDQFLEKHVDKEKLEKKAEELKETGKKKYDELVRDLAAFDMQKIDEWVEKNHLNQYGDKIDTVYEKGSPLLDAAGQIKNKYEYILENHPELIEELKLKVK
jgi:hypothetical protein